MVLLAFAPALHDAMRDLVEMHQAKEARAEAEAKQSGVVHHGHRTRLRLGHG